MTALILYTTEDGKSQIKLRTKDQTREATTEESSVVQTEGIFFDRNAFLGRYEFSLPEIFGRTAKDANGVVPA